MVAALERLCGGSAMRLRGDAAMRVWWDSGEQTFARVACCRPDVCEMLRASEEMTLATRMALNAFDAFLPGHAIHQCSGLSSLQRHIISYHIIQFTNAVRLTVRLLCSSKRSCSVLALVAALGAADLGRLACELLLLRCILERQATLAAVSDLLVSRAEAHVPRAHRPGLIVRTSASVRRGPIQRFRPDQCCHELGQSSASVRPGREP